MKAFGIQKERGKHLHTNGWFRAVGLVLAIGGPMVGIIVGASLWEVSETASRNVGLYGSAGAVVLGMIMALLDGCGSWIEWVYTPNDRFDALHNRNNEYPR